MAVEKRQKKTDSKPPKKSGSTSPKDSKRLSKKEADAKEKELLDEITGKAPSKNVKPKKLSGSMSDIAAGNIGPESVQSRFDPKTGEMIADKEGDPIPQDEDDDFMLPDRVTRDSQAKIVAELTGITMKPSQRTFALKIVSPQMIEELTRIYAAQRGFMLKFRVPVEKENNKVKRWQTVEFETRLSDLSLKGDKATCHGMISHEGACAMSELIHNWKAGIEFFLDGIQQSLI